MKDDTMTYGHLAIAAQNGCTAIVPVKADEQSGRMWLNPTSDPHWHDPKQRQGYGGSPIAFAMLDGTTKAYKGPWHSNWGSTVETLQQLGMFDPKAFVPHTPHAKGHYGCHHYSDSWNKPECDHVDCHMHHCTWCGSDYSTDDQPGCGCDNTTFLLKEGVNMEG